MYPYNKCIILSGLTEKVDTINIFAVVKKPIPKAELIPAIKQAFEELAKN